MNDRDVDMYVCQAVCAHKDVCSAVIITIQQCCSNISSSLLLADLNRFNLAA